MALATRCPNCGALFRVAADQLKSRGGMVRCGSCRRAFNAIGRLEYLDPRRAGNEEALEPLGGAETSAERRERPVPPPPAPALPVRVPSRLKDAARDSRLAASDAPAGAAMPLPTVLGLPPLPQLPTAPAPQPAHLAVAATLRPSPSAPIVTPPLEPTVATAPAPVATLATAPRPTALPAITVPIMPLAAHADGAPAASARNAAALKSPPADRPVEPGGDSTAIPIDEPAEETTAEPPRASRALVALERFHPVDEELQAIEAPWGLDDEPDFLRRVRPPGRASGARRAALAIGFALLVPCLLVEIALLMRASVLVHFPQLRPTLAALCAPLSCSVQWPMRPELLAVISSDLESQPGTSALEFTAVVRNRAAFPMALPSMELTITDGLNRPVARRIFTPADYLGVPEAAEAEARSLAPGEDLTIRLPFELRGVNAAGFVAYPFYP